MDKIQEIKDKITEIMITEGKEVADICSEIGMHWNTLDGFLRKGKSVRMDTLGRLWKYINDRK